MRPEVAGRSAHCDKPDRKEIVAIAKSANLPEAAPWSYSSDMQAAYYSDSFDVYFYLGSAGKNAQYVYDKDSVECSNMMPKDWNQFLPTNLTSRGRQLFSNAQEVKQPPLSTQEVQTDVSDAQGPVDDNSDSHDTMFDQETVSRRSMEDPSSGFTAAPAAAEASNAVATNTCPRYRIIMNEHIKLVHNPLCRGPWLKSLQQRKQKVRQAMQRMSKECAIAAVLPGDPRHNDTSLKRVPYGMEGDHKLDVKAQGRECRYKPTSRQELDARDTTKNAEMTAVKSANSVPLDFDAKLQKLVKGLCFYQSGADCEVDASGSTQWWKMYFSAYPIVNLTLGADNVTMDEQSSFSSVTSTFFCGPNPNAKFVCQASSADMSSTAEIKSVTSTWNFQFKVGVKVKASAGFPLLPKSVESETEMTFDAGFSNSQGTSTTNTDGTSTTATVKVPVSPNMCARISLVTRKISGAGNTRAWICVDKNSWVGTHQDPPVHWKTVDEQKDEKHYFRAMKLWYVVQEAQKFNLRSSDAFDWYIDKSGRACVANVFDMTFKQGVMSYVKPELFDKDSTECTAGQAAIASRPAVIVPASRTGQSDELIVEATPLEQVEKHCLTFENCGE